MVGSAQSAQIMSMPRRRGHGLYVLAAWDGQDEKRSPKCVYDLAFHVRILEDVGAAVCIYQQR